MPIIPQISTTNKSITTLAKSINLYTIRNATEHTFKKYLPKALLTTAIFKVWISSGGSEVSPS